MHGKDERSVAVLKGHFSTMNMTGTPESLLKGSPEISLSLAGSVVTAAHMSKEETLKLY